MRDSVAAMVGVASHRLSKTDDNIPEYVGGWAIWRGIATPGFIREQIDMLYSDTLALSTAVSAEIKAKHSAGENYSALQTFHVGAVAPFMKAVSDFHDKHQNWSSNMWGSILDTVNEYRERLVELYNSALKIGLNENTPKPKGSTEFGDPTLGNLGKGATNAFTGMFDEIWKFIKSVSYILIGAAVLVVVVFLFRGGGIERVLTPKGRLTSRMVLGGNP